RIACGEASIIVAGGVESISLVQFNLNLNGFVYEPLEKRMPAVWWTMNQTADFVAKKYNITREALDTYVVESQKRVAAATAAGKYAAEIVPFKTTMKVIDKTTKQPHAGGDARSRRGTAPRHHVCWPGCAQASLSERDDNGGQCLAIVGWRRCRRDDGGRSRCATQLANSRSVSRHASGPGCARRDEQSAPAGDPKTHEISTAQ